MFHSPWAFGLLVIVPLAAWRLFVVRRSRAVQFSTVVFASRIQRSFRQRISWLSPALTLLGLTLLIIALARPREGRQQAIVESEGIAIEMVVDRSGSMQAMDFQIDGQNVDRLTAIKKVAGSFIEGDPKQETELAGRISDLVGLVTFAGYADAITPPTLDHAFLVSQLANLRIVDTRSEDGTAIGDAISLAIEKLNTLDDRREEKIKSKVIILLTDGENNAGEFDPLQAAELAKAMDVRVYTIGVGTRGRAPVPVIHPFSGRQVIRMMEVNIDEQTLREIAAVTGGKYFRATDTDSLRSIYSEIDQLEKTEVESKNFTDYRELAIQPFRWSGWSMPPLVLLALLVLVSRFLLDQTLFRRLV